MALANEAAFDNIKFFDLHLEYKLIIEFLNDLKSKFTDEGCITVSFSENFNEKLNYKTADFNFVDSSLARISFCVSLTLNDFEDARFMLSIRKPNSDNFYSIIDSHFESAEDAVSSLDDLKAMLSHEFLVTYQFFEEKLVREYYLFTLVHDNLPIQVNDLGYSKVKFFSWNKKKLSEQKFYFKSWLKSN